MTPMTLRVMVRVVFMVIGVNNMKTFLNVFGAIALAVGLMTIAGSANDCDGKCMEYANDLPTMLMMVGYGLISMLGGAACLLTASKL